MFLHKNLTARGSFFGKSRLTRTVDKKNDRVNRVNRMSTVKWHTVDTRKLNKINKLYIMSTVSTVILYSFVENKIK